MKNVIKGSSVYFADGNLFPPLFGGEAHQRVNAECGDKDTNQRKDTKDEESGGIYERT